MILLGVAAAAGAAWLACRPVPTAGSGVAPSPWMRPIPGWPVLVAGPAAAWTVLPANLVVLGALMLVSGAAALRLWRRRAARLAARAEAARVREACEHLAAELAAGQPPGSALHRVADACAALGPAAEAFSLGADVPEALRRASVTPGHRDLRLLGAAWQVAHHTGAGLAVAVGRIAESLRADQQTARLVAGELASARSTARMVAALPLLALAMGSGAGGSPVRFLLLTPLGLGCLAGGLLLTLAGMWWIEVLTGDVT